MSEALAELGDRATGEAVSGVARDELVALSEHVDLLVLGSRGYGPVRRIVLGRLRGPHRPCGRLPGGRRAARRA